MMRRHIISFILLLLAAASLQAAVSDTLRVLAIGNSFSADAVEQDLYGLFEAEGQPVVLANLFGNSLASHEEWIKGDLPKYKYRKIVNGEKTAVKGKKFSEAFAEEKWDVITIQQVSQESPDYGTYEPHLKWLLRYLRRHAKGAKIMWHQTWAYETGDAHSGYLYDHYGAQSSAMFKDIAVASRQVHENYGLEVIPSGAAIENLRTGFTREGASRDGCHLSLTIGRYTASCVWFEALTGRSCIGNSYVPYTLQNQYRRDAAQRAAHDAMLHPYEITSQRSGRGQYGSAEAGFFHTDESQAAQYTLPDPLVMNDGTPVTTAEQWMQERRPELLEMFRTEVYGHSAPRQEGQHYKVLSEEPFAVGGLATRKEIAVYYTADETDRYMQLLLYVPNHVEGPVPAFLIMNLSGNISVDSDESILDYNYDQLHAYGVFGIPARGQLQHRYPLSQILSRGYALATFYKGDADPDYDDGFKNGVQKYIYREDQSFPDPDQWGSVSAWAWGMSRAMDYLETDPAVDASRVAAIGHSRGGKTALWAAAQDERIAMAISNCSGCTGAALSSRKMGQTVRAIQVTFPSWFCLNYLKYMDNEEALPVDQHELISLIAPRPVYVASASLDYGADPRGEFLAEVAAMPVYKLLGHSGLESMEFPEPQSSIGGDRMAYHLREGKHDLQLWDWERYLDYADRYFCPSLPAPDAGVPYELARRRKEDISELRYDLSFDIPSDKSSDIAASETLTFELKRKTDIFMDVRGFEVHSLSVNGTSCAPMIENEHLRLPGQYLCRGANRVEISFTAGNQSLNRRDAFLYTLLVPDRARTLFPCFDQPDMKARYTLSLTVPEGWTAVSNTSVASRDGRTVRFNETEPLSTYLFSFVAGEFQCVTEDAVTAAGKPVHLYHRETDPAKLAQCREILGLVHRSLEWLEDYTGVDYPFAKYDLVVLPDFQYGGMEHTGATLYNDRRIFLGEAPTTEELLGRASLIAHETAHMWFGDYVTMKWFDDVWTKEVFANFFAAKMVRPFFPEVNHSLNDLRTLYASSYSEDRTVGSNAIQRPLDNLRNAGLIYCNIIYNKAPVMMSMLERRMGEDALRNGIRRYLASFPYSNAGWDDLIAIFSEDADFDVAEWSRVWVKEKGMPVFDIQVDGSSLTVTQSDPFGAGNIWQEDVAFMTCGDRSVPLTVSFSGKQPQTVTLPSGTSHVIPNADGLGYGWFRLSQEEASWLQGQWSSIDATARMSVLMTLYENVWHKCLDASQFVSWTCSVIRSEQDNLIRGSMLGYASSAALWSGGSQVFERLLRDIAADPAENHEFRLLAFRSLISRSDIYNSELLNIWRDMDPYPGLVLGERDYTSMAYQLMIRYPEMAGEIKDVQSARITNPDRNEAFMYVSRACAADKSDRDDFFRTLLSAETRGPEARVGTALSLLNSPLRYPESLEYILPALEVLEDIQRTGDIFFPANWCASLLSGHVSEEASAEVKKFVESNKNMSQLLMTKVLQRGGWLIQ